MLPLFTSVTSVTHRSVPFQVLPLFTSDECVTELILPDLHLVSEGALLEAFERLITPASRLDLVQVTAPTRPQPQLATPPLVATTEHHR